MISTGAYNYINVLEKASIASQKRHEVLSNNIANGDTPNYKRQDVNFESVLNGAIHNGDTLDEGIIFRKVFCCHYLDTRSMYFSIVWYCMELKYFSFTCS